LDRQKPVVASTICPSGSDIFRPASGRRPAHRPVLPRVPGRRPGHIPPFAAVDLAHELDLRAPGEAEVGQVSPDRAAPRTAKAPHELTNRVVPVAEPLALDPSQHVDLLP